MNIKMILYVLGKILKIEGLLLFLPVLVDMLYKESVGGDYLLVAISAVLIGEIVSRREPENKRIYAKEGFFIVGVSWVLLSLFGAVPFVLTGEIPSYIDALFETVSGFFYFE